MGIIEIDDRGRITIPKEIREKLHLQSGEKLTINTESNDFITLRKTTSKEKIFKELVGCITTSNEKKPTPESIKGIWNLKE